LAVILASKKRNSIANKLLAAAMLAFTLELLTTVYHDRAIDEVWPHFIGVTYPFPFLFSPLLYLYAKTVSEGGHVFHKAYLLHFIPVALVVVYMIPFYAQGGAGKLALLHQPDGHPWMQSLTLINYVKFGYSFVYLVVIVRMLIRHRERIKDTFSSVEHLNLTWLRHMMIGGAAMWGVALVFFVIGRFHEGATLDPIEGYDDYVAVGMAMFVYAMGYLGLRQPEIFTPRMPEHRPARADAAAPQAEPGSPPSVEKPRYARSGMDPKDAERRVEDLLAVMERDRPFTRSDLTLQDLADVLSLSPHNLSEVINTQLEKNFYDFVNGYRVEEAQRRLADPDQDHLTVLAIGLDAGFNSKSSFNAVFKKHAKMTPSQYREHARTNVA
jgi:AraC-like DNA-binding protein